VAGPIEFWFDFSSPYGYVGAQLIDDVASLPVMGGAEGPSAWTLSLILKYAREAD
jgi:hypothetical protein